MAAQIRGELEGACGKQEEAVAEGETALAALREYREHAPAGTDMTQLDQILRRLTHRLSLQTPSFTIQVSQDDAPLLYVGSLIMQKVDVYDLKTGVVKNSIGDLTFPTILQNLH